LRHTLRNKLTSILSPATAIRKGRSDDVAADAERIYAAATELEALSDAAGEVEQIMGTAHVDRERVDLVGLLDDIVESSRTAEAEAKIELDRPSSLSVAADYRVGIAIRNLVENALEHGGETPSVAVTGTRVDGEVVVTVTDDGPGIPEHVRSVVFGDRDVTQLDHGTGLGLWLTRWIIESYGGLLVYSRRGGETTVSIRLPTVDGGGEPGDRERRK
jgi:signal transduction histidine kinase